MRYEKFILKDVLSVKPTVKLKLSGKNYVMDKDIVSKDGTTPYIAAISTKNGVSGYSNFPPTNKGDCITLSTTTDSSNTVFYQKDDFIGRQQIAEIRIIDKEYMGEDLGLYLVAIIKGITKGFNYSSKLTVGYLNNCLISLPILINLDNTPIIDPEHKYHPEGYIPNWQYMQDYIKELEQDYIKELEQYLIATGLNDYELTDEDIKILSLSGFGHYEKRDSEDAVRICKEFKVSKNNNEVGLFNCYRGTRLTKANRVDGNIPLLTAGVGLGEGVAQTIQETSGLTKYSKDITIDMFGTCFYHDYEHYGDDNIHFLVNDDIPEKAKLFLTQVLQKQLSGQFSYGRQFRMNFLEKMTVSLPVQTDADNNPIIDTECKYHPDGYIPDWDFMEKYIKAIEKIVIADVVKYKESVISKTKEVIAQEGYNCDKI